VTVRRIRTFGDPVLRAPCREVVSFDQDLAALVTDLMDTCRLPGRAGLAAPQIGVNLRVFSYNVDGDEGYLVNPTLIHIEGHQDDDEGCLSIPGIFVPTPRAWRAVVAGVDLEGRAIEVDGTGVLGRCLQHETDHLDGHLYIDRLEPERRRQVLAEVRKRALAETLRRRPSPLRLDE
jgi:peptide deformylase